MVLFLNHKSKGKKEMKKYKRSHSKEESRFIREMMYKYLYATSKKEQKFYSMILEKIEFF